jgi:hypothetical protein
MNLSLAIFHDEETAKEWGWVQVRWVVKEGVEVHHSKAESVQVFFVCDTEQVSNSVLMRRKCMLSR